MIKIPLILDDDKLKDLKVPVAVAAAIQTKRAGLILADLENIVATAEDEDVRKAIVILLHEVYHDLLVCMDMLSETNERLARLKEELDLSTDLVKRMRVEVKRVIPEGT